MSLALLAAVASLHSPLCTRRSALTAGAAIIAAPRAASAFDVKRYVTSLDTEATTRTPADFTQVIEMTPMSGPTGVKNALVTIDAENAGEFDFVWIKDAKTGKVLGTANKLAPPPMRVRATVERGSFFRALAYSKEQGLYESDVFEVKVGDYRPPTKYEGRPNGPIGIMGEGVYKR